MTKPHPASHPSNRRVMRSASAAFLPWAAVLLVENLQQLPSGGELLFFDFGDPLALAAGAAGLVLSVLVPERPRPDGAPAAVRMGRPRG